MIILGSVNILHLRLGYFSLCFCLFTLLLWKCWLHSILCSDLVLWLVNYSFLANYVPCLYRYNLCSILYRMMSLVIISLDKSQGYTGFTSVVPPPYISTCACNNSKMLSQISFKLDRHVFKSGEESYFKVTLNSQ